MSYPSFSYRPRCLTNGLNLYGSLLNIRTWSERLPSSFSLRGRDTVTPVVTLLAAPM